MIGRSVVHWFRREGRDLPWRRNLNPYRVWVSEIMLQQTRVETVIPYYRRFMKRFSTVRKLAAARVDGVLKCWEGLGYYARARNLHEAARIIVKEHGGYLPESSDEWATLPGVGTYTAAAIASITEGETTPVLDANARRVASRLIVDHKGAEVFLNLVVSGVDAGDFNQGIMELGQRICTPGSPKCPSCPVQKHCRAFRAGAVDRFPKRRTKKPVPHLEVVVGVCRRAGRYLVARRWDEGLLGRMWQFPGGRVRKGQKPRTVLRREYREEVGVQIRIGDKFAEVPHRYSHFSVRLHAFHCRWGKGKARAIQCAAVRWVTMREMKKLAFPTAGRKIISALEKEAVRTAPRGGGSSRRAGRTASRR